MNITIRDVNPRYWQELKVEAVKEGLTIGEVINLALDKWLHQYRNKKTSKKIRSFWDLKPIKFEGKDAEQLSTKIDEVLYGWKN